MNKRNLISYLPGLSLSISLALFARWTEGLLPFDFIGASVIAMFIGMLLNPFWQSQQTIEFGPGIQFASKRILKFAIICLGASLNIHTILNVGRMSLLVMIFTLLTCFGGGYLIGKALHLDWKLSSLINAGTGICGGSAIAAIAPVIEAEDHDIAYAISATFIFDILMILLFPIMGHYLHLSDIAYGLWTGTAVNDTSSVVAAGYAFSEQAGDFATMVKLTRTLVIIPTVLIFSLIHYRIQRQQAKQNKHDYSFSLSKIFPWFILGFLFLASMNSLAIIPKEFSMLLKQASKFMMVIALGAIGLKTNLQTMKKSGYQPMFHGFIISVLVVIVSLAVEYFMGII